MDEPSILATDSLDHLWWQRILSGGQPMFERRGKIRAVDLFCGTGGLGLGHSVASEAAGLEFTPRAAVDIDAAALEVYRQNYKPRTSLQVNLAAIIDYHVYGRGKSAELAYRPEILDSGLSACVGATDLLLAGPP